jgi:hypothetical protein
MPKLSIDFVSDKFSMIFSNSHMSKVPLCLNGMKQHQDLGCFFISSTPGKNCCTFTICTIGTNMGVSIFSDENSIPNPKEFLEIYEQQYFEVMKRLKE